MATAEEGRRRGRAPKSAERASDRWSSWSVGGRMETAKKSSSAAASTMEGLYIPHQYPEKIMKLFRYYFLNKLRRKRTRGKRSKKSCRPSHRKLPEGGTRKSSGRKRKRSITSWWPFCGGWNKRRLKRRQRVPTSLWLGWTNKPPVSVRNPLNCWERSGAATGSNSGGVLVRIVNNDKKMLFKRLELIKKQTPQTDLIDILYSKGVDWVPRSTAAHATHFRLHCSSPAERRERRRRTQSAPKVSAQQLRSQHCAQVKDGRNNYLVTFSII